MNIEKAREEFEAWWLEGVYPLRRMDRMEDAGVSEDLAQEIWQASRASLVIELPRAVGFEGAYDSMQDHEFCPRMSDIEDADEIFSLCRTIEVRESIEAAGLKVK